MNMHLLLFKAKRKLIKLFKHVFSHNRKYKPTGIYQTSKAYITSEKHKQASYTEIYPDLATELKISEAFYQSCSAYLETSLSISTTYLIVSLPNGRVHTDNATSVAIISQDNKLVADVSFSYLNGKTVKAERNNIFRQRYFIKPKKYKGTVFTLLTGGSGVGNYFHWLIDVLPRLHLLKASGLFDKVNYFLIPAYIHNFQKQSLQLLGISAQKLISGNTYEHIEADILIASSAPRGSGSIIPYWVCNFLRQSFLQPSLLEKPGHAFIYISRSDSRYRHVINEQSLSVWMEKHGFKTYVLSKLSFIEQIRIFSSAQVIVAPHGAGLINLVFCKKGTKLIEFFAGGYIKASYCDLAGKVGVEYQYLIDRRSPKVKNAKKGMQLDIFIEQEELKQMLYKTVPELSFNLSDHN